MEKTQTRHLFVDQNRSGAKPLRGFANIALILGIVFAASILLLAYYEVMGYLQAFSYGVPLLLFSFFLYYFCRGLATIVENAAIQKAIAMDQSEKEGLIVYERER